MRPYGRGILPQSQIYLYDVSEVAKRVFLYALCVGHYMCDADYIVNRSNYDSYLLIYVKRGVAYCCDREHRRIELPQGSFALIDCYRSHEYGAIDPCELYWVHFDGSNASELVDLIRRDGVLRPRNPDRCRDNLVSLIDRTAESGPLQDAIVNRFLVNILTEFLVNSEQSRSESNETIEDIRNYIMDNPNKNLTLEALASRASMSPYHFARTFKRFVGVSPHEYLIHARINLATFYLMSTGESVKQIAYNCGFTSECGFCTAFKKRMGATPTGYRLSHLKSD